MSDPERGVEREGVGKRKFPVGGKFENRGFSRSGSDVKCPLSPTE
jgi:hypothetical protein